MKVAYNACFGGFSLSPAALTEFAKRKGVVLTWYKQVGYRHQGAEEYKRVEGIPEGNRMTFYSLTSDFGSVINSLPSGEFYYPDFDELRTDSDLIDIIESMGEKANGSCAELAVAVIPDGATYEIDYYDGKESVVPPRMSW